MTHAELIVKLEKKVAQFGSQRAYAKHLKISAVHLGEILKGSRMPGRESLERMGLHRVVTYEPLEFAPVKGKRGRKKKPLQHATRERWD